MSRLLTATLVLTSLAACEVAPDEPLAADQTALNGTVLFTSLSQCSTAEQQLIEAAADIAHDQVAGSGKAAMLRCLNEAGLSQYDDGFAEMILAQLAEAKPTEVRCRDLAVGTGQTDDIGVSFERFNFDRTFLAGPCAASAPLPCPAGVDIFERTASVFLHEVSHNKGYRHAPPSSAREYFYTVPEQIKWCSMAISGANLVPLPRGDAPQPNGALRQLAETRVELHRAGGNGGTPFGVNGCGVARFARGLGLRIGTRIDAMALRCDNNTGSGTPAPTSSHGGTGGNAVNRDCPTGSLLVGVHGRALAEVDALGPVCASVDNIAANSTTVTRLTTSGGTGGVAFERLCPVGMAVKGFAGRAANRLDQLNLVCQELGESYTPSASTSARGGTATSEVYQERCTTGVLTGLLGQHGTVIDRLAGECSAVERDGVIDIVASPQPYPLAGHGGMGGEDNAWGDLCPAGEGIIGFELRAGSKLDQIRGICADVSLRVAGGSPTSHPLPNRGGTGGILVTSMCLAPKFVTGWDITISDYRVSSLRPICTEL